MALTPEKRSEVLEILLMEYMAKEEIRLSPVQIRRDVGNLSAKTGVDFDDLCEVISSVVSKITAKAFLTKKKVSIPNANKYTTTFSKKQSFRS